MEKLTLSAFSDEYSSNFDEQLAAMRDFGIGYIELRHADGKNISELTSADVKVIKQKLDESGIGVKLSHLELTRVGMPEEVRDIYELVNSTNIQASTRIEQARQYYETRIPGAEAEANALIAEAQANYANWTAAANSDLYEFYGVLEEYNANPEVVRVRLYNTAITNIIRKIGSVKIVDDSDSQIVIYY